MAQPKTNAMRILEQNGASYRVHSYASHGGPVDGAAVAREIGQPPEAVFKTLVTQGKSGAYYVFVLPVLAELDLKKAAAAVGEKSVAMIPVKDISRVTGYIRGGCSPVGMKKQFVTVIEQCARQRETMLVSAGKIGLQMELAPLELQRVTAAGFACVAE